ncbi:hypothetical protein HKBW3S43_01448 [Candidatus Hakubella thermalkaliphila]|uniref:HTH cro/C1-type domain-containing protein n=1 Tax=Candidatus Hakubella thermalkaliphila TaxID=2754717 RepID=A0A6V8QA33_9ACTN|nr:hypothetical protein HKBW3S25_01393 [Candidatus Hakubella thermalkaliphila]GFP35659.1 hypothetical protein HKBW3S43_01448 [Candidatus Hakubella thermalkaliphila]GFP41250.1 hypothetical protein HKBW3C_00376 [Candidatus Hakubella thermalkaliphila]
MEYQGVLRIRLLRQAKGLTQEEVAHALAMRQPTYSFLESGRLRPSKRQVSLLEAYFGEPVEKLLKPWKPRKEG